MGQGIGRIREDPFGKLRVDIQGRMSSAGMIGVREEGQFRAESLEFKVKKENAGRGFNAEIAEDAECAEVGAEIGAGGLFTTKDTESALR